MPLAQCPVTASPEAVAEILLRSHATPLADVLLAQAFVTRASWAPFYDRPDIPAETWAQWSTWLLGRLEHATSDARQAKGVTADSEWLARTMVELAAHPGRHQPPLQQALRRILGLLEQRITASPDNPWQTRHWWLAQLATALADGVLGPVTAEEMATAVEPWVNRSTRPTMPATLRWGVQPLTAGWEHGLLTTAQVEQFLRRGGAQALASVFAQDRTMLEVPGWRAAWWSYRQRLTSGPAATDLATAFLQHGTRHEVRWSTWTPEEVEAWWGWVIAQQAQSGALDIRLTTALQCVLEKVPEGPWLAAQPGFHWALRPLLESPEGVIREAGLRLVGMTDPTRPQEAEGPATTPPASRQGRGP